MDVVYVCYNDVSVIDCLYHLIQVNGGGKVKLGTFGAYTITLTRPMHKKSAGEVNKCDINSLYVAHFVKINQLMVEI